MGNIFGSMVDRSFDSSSANVRPVSAQGMGKYEVISWPMGREDERYGSELLGDCVA